MVFRSLLLLLTVLSLSSLWGEEPEGSAKSAHHKLHRFQDFVGEWRGVGQPKRGSAQGAWSEESTWIWHFGDKHAALVWSSANGKFVRSASLSSLSDGKFEMQVSTPDGRKQRFVGEVDEQGTLRLVADHDQSGSPARLTFRLVAGGDRLLVLFEQRTGDDRYARLAEVGYTRKGSGFGQGASGVECVVTGGAGTIPVTHNGQTYYVCCSGCRDYFNEHAEEVLAEYRERKAAGQNKQRNRD